MNNITDRNCNGTIDIKDNNGFIVYTVGNNESGIVADLARRLCDYEEAINSEKLVETLNKYFDIPNDTYSYNLTRVKEAFAVGTMSLDDFEEFNEETTTDIVDYIRKNI